MNLSSFLMVRKYDLSNTHVFLSGYNSKLKKDIQTESTTTINVDIILFEEIMKRHKLRFGLSVFTARSVHFSGCYSNGFHHLTKCLFITRL